MCGVYVYGSRLKNLSDTSAVLHVHVISIRIVLGVIVALLSFDVSDLRK